MGEAKRRMQTDPFFGRTPKRGRGIVISPPVTITENGSLLANGAMNPIELRRAVLFWDRLNKPRNNLISFGLSADEEYLMSCGLLEELETVVGEVSGMAGHVYSHLHIEAFRELEKREPGLWVMSEGENSFNLSSHSEFSENRGALVELYRAIPLPTQDVPLEDLLNFKEKRRDEILSLTLELDSLFATITKAEDTAFELQRAIRKIDKGCSDVLSAGKESNINFSLSNFTYGVSLEVNSTNLLHSGILGGVIGNTFDLPIVGAAVGSASSIIKFSANLGGHLERSKKKREIALSPYRVVSRLLNEPI